MLHITVGVRISYSNLIQLLLSFFFLPKTGVETQFWLKLLMLDKDVKLEKKLKSKGMTQTRNWTVRTTKKWQWESWWTVSASVGSSSLVSSQILFSWVKNGRRLTEAVESTARLLCPLTQPFCHSLSTTPETHTHTHTHEHTLKPQHSIY